MAEIVAQVDAAKTRDDAKAEKLFQTLARNGTYQTPALVGWKRLVEFDDETPPANDYFRYVSKAVTDAAAATFGGFLGLLPAEFLETRKTLFDPSSSWSAGCTPRGCRSWPVPAR